MEAENAAEKYGRDTKQIIFLSQNRHLAGILKVLLRNLFFLWQSFCLLLFLRLPRFLISLPLYI